jgi:hypothetical protein
MKPLILTVLLAFTAWGQLPKPGNGGGGSGSGSGSTTYCNGTLTANAIACTTSPVTASYVTGMLVSLQVSAGNTGATTINLGPGVKNILLNGSALASGALATGNTYLLSYDGTQFNLQPGAGGALGTSIPYVTHTIGSGDCGNNPVATGNVTLPATPVSANCPTVIENISAAATTLSGSGATIYDTIAPTGSTATRSIQPGQSAAAWTDGTSYYVWYSSITLSGTTGAIGGGVLTASCATGTVGVAAALTTQVATASPTADITTGGTVAFSISARVSTAGTVTVYVCGTGTPTSTTYLVRVQ